jgi:hypothetical protein
MLKRLQVQLFPLRLFQIDLTASASLDGGCLSEGQDKGDSDDNRDHFRGPCMRKEDRNARGLLTYYHVVTTLCRAMKQIRFRDIESHVPFILNHVCARRQW